MKKIHILLIAMAPLLFASYVSAESSVEISNPEDAVAVNPNNASSLKLWRSLKKGMTQEEVRLVLGEPWRIDDDFTDHPSWYYSEAGYPWSGCVKFGSVGPLWNQKKRVVVEWHEPYSS